MKRIRIIPLLLFILILAKVNPGFSQNYEKVQNLPNYDDAPYHFGFLLAVNEMIFTIDEVDGMSNIKFVTSQIPDFPADSAFVMSVEGSSTYGFTIGIIGNLRMGRYFDFRFVPDLSFGERNLVYRITKYKNGVSKEIEQVKKIYSTFVEFPLHIKYKSKRYHNTRAYVFGGIKYAIDLASEAKKNQDELDNKHVRLEKNDLYLEVGVGFDFYTTYFKFGTEIKMGYGLNDLLVPENNIYTDVIDKVTSKIFQITFTFE